MESRPGLLPNDCRQWAATKLAYKNREEGYLAPSSYDARSARAFGSTSRALLRFYRDSKRGRAIARVWAKKAGHFTPMLKQQLAQAGLPTDLVWLSMIESGHDASISSRAGAAGLWQFMPATARRYGLVVDRLVDERLDPLKSTQAAIAYLRDLYQHFGSWELAMAGYNMGHGGLMRSVQRYNTNDFWQLCRYEAAVPWETALYVPKIFALALVMNNKPVFGLSNQGTASPRARERVVVTGGTSLRQIARGVGVSRVALSLDNPQFLKARLPKRKESPGYEVILPPGGTGAFA